MLTLCKRKYGRVGVKLPLLEKGVRRIKVEMLGRHMEMFT